MGFVPRDGGMMDCGSVFAPDTMGAEIFDTLSGSPGGAADDCDKTLSGAKVWVFGLLGIGVLAGLLAIAVPNESTKAKDNATV